MTARITNREADALRKRVFGSDAKPKACVEHIHAKPSPFSLGVDARQEVRSVVLTLPFPPSVNNLFFNVAGRGRVPTPRYAEWLNEAAWIIAEARPGRVGGRFEAHLLVGRPDNRRRDLDNLFKPVLDCAVKNRLVTDDSLAEKITAQWSDEIRGVVLTLSKWEARP